MAAGISPALAGILRPRREQYNQQVRQRRHTRLGFDESAVTRLVRDLLDPIANQLSDRESLPRLIDSLFELGLELISQRWIGRESRDPELIAAWFQLLQALPGVLLAAPTRLPAALFNALLQLRQAGADAAGWCRQLAHFGSTLDTPDTLLDLGRFLAWQAGLAPQRAAALAAAGRLPPALAGAALGVAAEQWPAAYQRLQQDPWWLPTGRCTAVRRLGGYAELGGPFSRPPNVASRGNQLWVGDGDRVFLLFADAYGQVLHPVGVRRLPKQLGAAPTMDDQGQMFWDGRRYAIDPLAAQGSAACTTDSIAIASVWSHRLWVLPRP